MAARFRPILPIPRTSPGLIRQNLMQRLQFYAAPSIEGDRVVFGDYGAAGGFFSPSVTVSIYAVENTDSGGTPPELWVDGEKADDKIVAPPLQVGDALYIGNGR